MRSLRLPIVVLVSAAPALAQRSFASWSGFEASRQDQARFPYASVLADFDNDGDVDAAFSHSGSAVVTVARNQGNGAFAVPQAYAIAQPSRCIIAADFDGDGFLDLVASGFGNNGEGSQVSLLRGTGSSFLAAVNFGSGGSGPVGLAAADFDADGRIDLAVAHSGINAMGSTVGLLRNNGAGGFQAAVSYAAGAGVWKLAAGDVDGDGDVDLAVARSERRISLLANTGGAFAAPQSFTLLAGSGSDAYRQIALSDVDRDGDLDMLYASNTLNGTTGPVVGLYRNAGGGTFGAVEQIALDAFSSSPTDMAVADVTGDGWPDLLVAEHLAWTFVRGNGSGGFTAPQSRIGGQGPIAIGAADMDADGDVEPVITNRDSLELTVHWNEGQGQLLVPPSYPAGSLGNAIAHGDVDQDGDLDVAVSYGYTGAGGVLILRNQGNGSFAPAVSYTGGAAIRVKLRDMNGDGKLDLLYADGGPPYDFHVRLNLGAGAFGAASTVPIHTCGNGDIEAFDADHDGDLDVFVTEYLGCPSVSINRCFISRNQGDGTFLPHQILTTYLKCEIIGFGRLDGDLHDDLILTSANGVEVYRGNGDATFQPPVLYDTDWGPKHMVVADLSGDGELDVASYNFGDTVTGTGGESMSILIGNGNGSFQPRVTYHASYSPDLGNPEGIEAVDFDGDSDLDILGGNYGSNDFSVYENLGNGTYRPQARYGTGMRTLDIAAADFDGDGRVDVVGVVGLPPSGLSTAIVFVRGRQNATPATSFCAGDAQTGGCPCGTSTVAGHGCPNSAAASGGRLATSGFADLSADTLRLTCTDVPNGPALYFQGTDAQNGGAGFAFGDGKLCAGGLIVRLGIAFAASNTSSWPDADPAHRISVVGLAAAGDLRHYQAWYRDADPGFCTSATFNTTNGVSLTWTP